MEVIEEHKVGYKKTKLGWIPNNWNAIQIGNYSEIRGRIGWKGLKQSEYVDEGVYLVANKHIKRGKISFQECDRITLERYEESMEIALKEGDVIFSKDGTLGNPAHIDYLPEKATINGTMMLVRVNNNLDSQFLFQCLNSILFDKLVREKASGGAIPHIFQRDMKKFLIPHPPLNEQKKIAAILSDWDEAIEKIQTLIEKLQMRKKGLMQQLLTGKTRLAGFTDKWRKVNISEIASQFTDKNKEDDDIEVLSCTKYDGLVRSLDYFGRKVFGDDLSKYKVVPRGYFAYATNHIEEGSIGYQDIMEKGLVSPMYTVFKTDDAINDSFMFRLLKTDRMIYNYQSNMSGSIARRGGLRWNVFETILVTIPSLEEQNAIADLFDKIDLEIEQQQNYLEQLQAQKKGLMQQLLTGKIRTI